MLKTMIIMMLIITNVLITMIHSCAETVEQCPTAGELLVPGGKASRANLEPCPSGCFLDQNSRELVALLLLFKFTVVLTVVQQDVALLLVGTAAGRGWGPACVPWILRIALET